MKCTSSVGLQFFSECQMPAPRAHALGQAGVDQPAVALGVLVLELAVEHPRHDLHVAMRVGVEPGAAGDPVVVQDEELTVVGVVGRVVTAEAERVLRVEPSGSSVEPLAGAADVDR